MDTGTIAARLAPYVPLLILAGYLLFLVDTRMQMARSMQRMEAASERYRAVLIEQAAELHAEAPVTGADDAP